MMANADEVDCSQPGSMAIERYGSGGLGAAFEKWELRELRDSGLADRVTAATGRVVL